LDNGQLAVGWRSNIYKRAIEPAITEFMPKGDDSDY
jgi:hypothetical protein